MLYRATNPLVYFVEYSCLQARKSLYIVLIRSKLLYCSPLWRPYLLEVLKKSSEQPPNLFYLITIQTTDPGWSSVVYYH